MEKERGQHETTREEQAAPLGHLEAMRVAVRRTEGRDGGADRDERRASGQRRDRKAEDKNRHGGERSQMRLHDPGRTANRDGNERTRHACPARYTARGRCKEADRNHGQ